MATDNQRFPHLLPADIAVWKAFLALQLYPYSHIDYDVRVGEGRDPGPAFQPNIRSMALDLSRRRIDAIGYLANEIHIIEITQEAGTTAIGQLSVYPILYAQTYHPLKPLRCLLVCSALGTGIPPALENLGITVHIVTPTED